jgi:hypothetical protein
MHYLAFEAASPSDDLRAAQRDSSTGTCASGCRARRSARDAREPSSFYSALASVAAGFCLADLGWLKQPAPRQLARREAVRLS